MIVLSSRDVSSNSELVLQQVDQELISEMNKHADAKVYELLSQRKKC